MENRTSTSGMTRRAMVGLCAAAGLATLAGCNNDNAETPAGDAGASGEGAPSEGGSKELTVFVVSSLATLDAQNDSNSDDNDITNLLGEGLYRYDADGTTPVPGMAESYEVSDDGLTYTFTLKEGMKWQDGADVTADQFVYSLQRFYDPATASENANSYLSYVEGAGAVYNGEIAPEELSVSAPDDLTFEVTMGAVLPQPTVLAFFAGPTCYPQRSDMIEQGGDGWSTDPSTHLSNGTYILDTYAPDDRVVLVRNDAYTGDAPAEADKITFMLYADTAASEVAMGNGELAFYRNASESLIAQMDGKATLQTCETLGTALLYMNNASEPFDDPKVREAVFRGIDATYARDTLENGYAQVAEGIVGDVFSDPQGGSFREAGEAVVPAFSDEELQAAKDALAEAGYENGEGLPKLSFITTSTAVGTSRAEFFQAMLRDNLGVEVEVESFDIPAYLDRLVSGNFNLAYANVSVSCDNSIELLQQFTTEANNYGIAVPEFDELIEQAMAEPDPATQSELLHQAERVLIADNYAIRPVCYSYTNIIYASDAEDVVICPTGNCLFNYMKLASWA